MKIKKHIVAAALAVGMVGSAGATATATDVVVADKSAIGFYVALQITDGMPSTTEDGLIHVAAVAAGGSLSVSAFLWSATVGGTWGAVVGGPIGLAVGAVAGAV